MTTSLEGINEIIQRIHGFQCPPNLRVCTKIGCLGTATPTRCARYPSWCVGFRCTGCAKSWNVCKVCSPVGKQLNRMTKNVDKNTHNKLHMKNENKRHINEEVHATRSKKQKKMKITSKQVTQSKRGVVQTVMMIMMRRSQLRLKVIMMMRRSQLRLKMIMMMRWSQLGLKKTIKKKTMMC